MSNTDLTAQGLRVLLHYNPETGVFTWLHSKGTAKAGAVAGTPHAKGYTSIKISGRVYLAHRLAWLHVYGAWPTQDLDHVNRAKNDNRLANLREVTHAENMQNRGLGRQNASGLKGASFHKLTGRWRAEIKLNGQRHYLGLFATAGAAHAAYSDAAAAMHTHRPSTD